MPWGKDVGDGVDGIEPGVGGLCGIACVGDCASFGEGCPEGWGSPGGPIMGPDEVAGCIMRWCICGGGGGAPG